MSTLSKLRYQLFGQPQTHNISQVKKRLIVTFAKIALSTSFVVFFAFSLRLILGEDYQLQAHLKSFESIATKHYQLEQVPTAQLSQSVTAYFDEQYLPGYLQKELPFQDNEVTQYRTYSKHGMMIYHVQFDFQGVRLPLYLTIGTRSIDFGDDSWDTLMGISMLLMIFLVVVLNFSVKRTFDELMAPVAELSKQLNSGVKGEFTVSEHSVDELKQLTRELNHYQKMRDRVAKQEMMFAKYASHELKTPISIVLGAANLQAMKDDPAFQTKQRERILTAAGNMHATVEVLLNIVKQENASLNQEPWLIQTSDITLADFSKKLPDAVALNLNLDTDSKLNFPPVVLNMILKNLVNNSIRFTEKGDITIGIASNEITVCDSGTGLGGTNETEHGLGLLIVRRLCITYGWDFEISDNEYQGCTAKLSRTL